jgi:succinate dehydrogenase hydrophobic anchor subunit
METQKRTRNVKMGFNFEYIMWLTTRLTGLAMILLALVGFIGALILGARSQMDLPTLVRWTFFPNPNHIRSSDIPEINQIWANGFWIVMEISIIFLATTHAWNGLRMIFEDFINPGRGRLITRIIIILLWLASLTAAIYLILTSWVS